MKIYQKQIHLFFPDDSPLGGKYWETHMESYSIMLYYAYLIDQENTRNLFKATASTWSYLFNYNLPFNGIVHGTAEGMWAYISIGELSGVISFISNQLLPMLQTEIDSGDRTLLLDRWGIQGVDFENYLYQQGDIFSELIVDTHNEMYEIPLDLFRRFDSLIDFFQMAIDHNQKYFVDIH